MIKLMLLAMGIMAIGMAGMAIKIFFTKDGKMPATSCGAVGPELQGRGVEACATGNCSPSESCQNDKLIETKPLELN